MRVMAWLGEHPRDADAFGHHWRGDRVRSHRATGRSRPDRRVGDAHPAVAGSAGGRSRGEVLAARADPALDVRLRSVRLGTSQARSRARGGGDLRPAACHASEMRQTGDVRFERDFHVRREPRDRYAVRRPLVGVRGDLVVGDTAGIRRLADRMNRARADGAPSVQAGEIAALGLLHEVGHLLIDHYETTVQPGAMAGALEKLEGSLGRAADRLLDRFADEFPGAGPEPEPTTERLEELLLTRIANENPAIGAIQELVDDRTLAERTRYSAAISELEAIFAAGPPLEGDGGSLIDLIR